MNATQPYWLIKAQSSKNHFEKLTSKNITWANAHPDTCRHMASQGHNMLTSIPYKQFVILSAMWCHFTYNCAWDESVHDPLTMPWLHQPMATLYHRPSAWSLARTCELHWTGPGPLVQVHWPGPSTKPTAILVGTHLTHYLWEIMIAIFKILLWRNLSLASVTFHEFHFTMPSGQLDLIRHYLNQCWRGCVMLLDVFMDKWVNRDRVAIFAELECTILRYQNHSETYWNIVNIV